MKAVGIGGAGDIAPGTNLEFLDFMSISLNDRGQALIFAEVTGNDAGIWVQDANGDLVLVVREGQEIDIDPTDGVLLRENI